jgi:hypothetical protein
MFQGLQIDGPAQRRFTDRQEPKKVFEDALNTPQNVDEHRVRVWYGVGGQGKTALMNECYGLAHSQQQQPPLKTARLDFKSGKDRDPIDALVKIRRELHSRRLAFPRFDLAFQQLLRLTHPGADPGELYPDIYRPQENDFCGSSYRF